MKKQNQSYAEVRIRFYEASLQNKNILQLVDEFNRLANSRGWTAERSYFSTALMNEMIQRGVNVSAIVEWNDRGNQILSVRYVMVRYDEPSKSLMSLN